MNRVVQSTIKQSASASSLTTTAISTTTGNAIIVAAVIFGNNFNATPITDSGGHTWSAAITSTGNTKGWGILYYCTNITGNAAHTFTVSTSGGNDFLAMRVFEVEGLQASPLNQTAAASASGTTHATSSVQANSGVDELFVGFGALSATAEGTPTVNTAEMAWSKDSLNAGASAEGIVAAVRFSPAGSSSAFSYTTANAQFETVGIGGFKFLSAGGGVLSWAPLSVMAGAGLSLVRSIASGGGLGRG